MQLGKVIFYTSNTFLLHFSKSKQKTKAFFPPHFTFANNGATLSSSVSVWSLSKDRAISRSTFTFCGHGKNVACFITIITNDATAMDQINVFTFF